MSATTAGTKTTMGLTGIRGFWKDSKSMEASTDAALSPIPRFGRRVLTFVLLAVLDVNLRLIRRFPPTTRRCGRTTPTTGSRRSRRATT